MPINANPYAPPAAPRGPLAPTGPSVEDGIPLGWRLAGGAFLLNALRNLVAQLLVGDFGFFLVGLDVVFGVVLLLRKNRWRRFAIARLVFAGLLLPGFAFAEGKPAIAGVEFALPFFTLLLLAGRASPVRVVLASAGFLTSLVLFPVAALFW